MRRLLYGILGMAVGYTVTRLLNERQTNETEDEEVDDDTLEYAKQDAETTKKAIVWLDGDPIMELDEWTLEAETSGAMPEELSVPTKKTEGPAFERGDVVVGFNPYSLDYTHFADDFQTPLFFEVQDIKYDDTDKTYRYLLGGEEDWIAEAWLMFPLHPVQIKTLEEETDMTDQLSKAPMETEMDGKVSELVRKAMIDRALDKLNNGTEGEKAEAKAMLAKLTKKHSKGDKRK